MQSRVYTRTIYMSKFDSAHLVYVFSELGLQLTQPNEDLLAIIETEKQYNAWFTPENVLKAVTGIGQMLNKADLTTWLNKYKVNEGVTKKVGLILAGNIPLV